MSPEVEDVHGVRTKVIGLRGTGEVMLVCGGRDGGKRRCAALTWAGDLTAPRVHESQQTR
jgi:hypothetical protein